jgi:type IV pilus assembly protein PilA
MRLIVIVQKGPQMLARIRKAMEEKDEGFTLIELLVVIIIIGILAAIAIPVFLNQRKNGYRAALKSDLKNAATAIESYGTDNNGSYVGASFGSTAADGTTTAGNVEFNKTTSVTLDLVGANATTYCLKAIDTRLGTSEAWYYNKATGVPSTTVCTAPPTTP